MFSLQTEEAINHTPNIKPDRWQWFWYIAIALSLVIGIIVRVKGIGNMVVSIDEYYTIKSIRNILKYGLPAFDLGGYYKRGLLYQYLQVTVLSVTGLKPEISFRLVNVVLNLLALPAIYQLGKKVSGRTVGYLAVILFSLSLWEIEFSRYIRWMVLFQTITVWYIYFLYKVIVEENEKYFLWMFLFSFLGIFAYEQVILLLALNFLPFVLRPKFFRLSRIGISAFLFVFGYSFVSFDFRRLGVENYLPTGVQVSFHGAHGNLFFPDLLVTTLPQNFLWFIFYLVIVFVTFYYVYTILTTGNVSLHHKISLILLLTLSLLNLYALLFVSTLILLLFNWITIEDIRNKYCKQFCLL
ncbi:MAG: ArnT family glycosyltransferase, partial [Calditrichia bacterium]